MEIRIIKEPIKKEELLNIAKEQFGSLVKVVVDVEQGIMAVGGEFHSEEEVLLMDQERSKRGYTWGINLRFDQPDEQWIEYDSMINIKPSFGNRSRSVESEEVRKKVREIVEKLVQT